MVIGEKIPKTIAEERVELERIEAEIEQLSEDRDQAEETMFHAEEELRELRAQKEAIQNLILPQSDLSNALPTDAWLRGYRLTDVKARSQRLDHWGKIEPCWVYKVLLEAPDGELVREWISVPSLTDIVEALRQ